MALVLTEEQELLRRTAREFVAARSPLKGIRQLRDGRDPVGFSRELWREMARLGWAGILIPEGYGGAGLGHTDLMVVLEELGRGLVPEPMLSTVLLGAEAVRLGGSEAQRSEHLPAVAGGDRPLALAYQERRSRYEPQHVETRGGRAAAFETTLESLKTRRQFGVPIGSFQALRHRAAKLYVEIELARSAVMAAHRALDDRADDPHVARMAGTAKARCADAYMLVGHEAVQMHGGIGMTDEHDVGFYLKAARAAEIMFGDAAYHRDRVARLEGY